MKPAIALTPVSVTGQPDHGITVARVSRHDRHRPGHQTTEPPEV
jgi:hypothetical protein